MDDLNLDGLEQATAGTLVLKHPVTGAATAARVQLAGAEHPARKQAVFARMRQRRAELQRTGTLTVPDPAEDEADEVELLAQCTLGWQGLAQGGQPLAYSPAAARALYADARFRWLREQVKAALDDRALFFAGSGTV